jgi:hypothetical protein
MYQPVSYRLHGRHGSRDDLRAMIHRHHPPLRTLTFCNTLQLPQLWSPRLC